MATLSILAIDQFRSDEISNEFYANSFAKHLAMHSDKISKPHKHNFYLVVLITKGTGVHEVDFQSYEVCPGSVFLMAPGATHNWELSPDISGHIFFHTREFFELKFSGRKVDDFPFYFSVQNSPVVYLKEQDIAFLEILFNEIQEEYNSEFVLKWQKIGALVDLIYIRLSRFYLEDSWSDSRVNIGYALKMRHLEELIDQQFLSIKSPSEYAEQMHMSSKHLNRIIKSLVNKTVTDIISDRIMLEAKRLLIHSDISVSELADELGYEDYSYFSRFFKKKSGQTPKQFRERYKSL